MNKQSSSSMTSYIPDRPDDRFSGHRIYPSMPSTNSTEACEGRETELNKMRIMLGLDEKWKGQQQRSPCNTGIRHVRLRGSSGVGKRSLVTQVADRVGLPFYELQGHADMSPEDLVLAVVPIESQRGQTGTRLILQASPLTTALIWGGVVYFNAMHRASEKALAPLASLLDGRQRLDSSLTGLQLTPRHNTGNFFFFCSWNSAETHRLPSFIDQRTIPEIHIDSLKYNDMKVLVGPVELPDSTAIIQAARKQNEEQEKNQLTRDIMALQETMSFAQLIEANKRCMEGEILEAFKILTVSSLPSFSKLGEYMLQMLIKLARTLSREAYELSEGDKPEDAAKGASIYQALLGAGVSNRYHRNNYAHCLMHMGHLEAASNEIKAVIESYHGDFAVAWITKGEILERQGRTDDARECYERARGQKSEPVSRGGTTKEAAERYLKELNQEG